MDDVLRLWPELLKAAAVGLAACVAVSRLAASRTAAIAASKSLVLSSGLIAAAAFFAASSRLQKNEFHRGKGKFRAHPPLRGTDDADGFTANSIRARLPRIIDDVIATMPELSPAAVENLQSLRFEIASDGVISPLSGISAPCKGKAIPVVDHDQEPEWPS
jgi:hypothetical protein